jgi:hypothetical protein
MNPYESMQFLVVAMTTSWLGWFLLGKAKEAFRRHETLKRQIRARGGYEIPVPTFTRMSRRGGF